MREVFEGALRLPAELRPAHVAAACGDDLDLRVQVEGLLTSHEESNDFLGPRTAWATIESLTARLEGSRAGAYRIVREIGRGGMGSVYLAERADGAFDQRVAIKVVNGIATDVLLAASTVSAASWQCSNTPTSHDCSTAARRQTACRTSRWSTWMAWRFTITASRGP